MGIRYSAAAFDADLSDIARTTPFRIVRNDPFDALIGIGCPPHCQHIRADEDDPWYDGWTQTCRGELDLERAWIDLQRLTHPAEGHVARPAYRMFEGSVGYDRNYGDVPWVGAILPDEVPAIRDDLRMLIAGFTKALRTGCEDDLPPAADCFDYDLSLLEKAESFTTCVVADRRGMIYVIA